MAGTHVYYNGVLLQDCELVEWDTTVEMTEDRVDSLFSRHRITVSSVLVSTIGIRAGDSIKRTLNEQDPSAVFVPPPAAVSTPEPFAHLAWRREEIERRLSEMRKDFWIAMNGMTHGNQGSDANPGFSGDAQTVSLKPYRIALAAGSAHDTEMNIRGVDAVVSGNEPVIPNLLRENCIDIGNGPRPLNVQVTHILGGRSMHVQFTIEVCRLLRDRPISDQPPLIGRDRVVDMGSAQGVISNRWSVSESCDADWRTTIEIQGELKVRDMTFKPMAMRLLVNPLMFPYAKFAGRTLRTSTDGLTLQYQYVMREEGIAPPRGVVDWDGTYYETCNSGGVTHATCRVSVTGYAQPPKDQGGPARMTISTYKQYLLGVAWHIALSRIQYNAPDFGVTLDVEKPILIQKVDAIEDMKRNKIDLILQAFYTDPEKLDGLGLRMGAIGAPIKYADDNNANPVWWPIPPAYPWDWKTPYATQDIWGTFYDCAPQTPESWFHGMPRGVVAPVAVPRDYAFDPETGRSGATTFDGVMVDPNIRDTDVDSIGRPGRATAGKAVSSKIGVNSDVQLSRSSYMHFQAENSYQYRSGIISAALSKQRTVFTQDGANPVQLKYESTPIRLYRPQSIRTLKMVASRMDEPPEIPTMLDGLLFAGIQEVLLDSIVVLESPQLSDSNQGVLYSAEAVFRYGLSRPVSIAGKYNSFSDHYRVPGDPRVKNTSDGLYGRFRANAETLHDKGDGATNPHLIQHNKPALPLDIDPN